MQVTVRTWVAGALLLATVLTAGAVRAGARLVSAGQTSTLATALTADPTIVTQGQLVGFSWRVGGLSFAPLTDTATATIDFGDGQTFYGGSGSGQVLNGTTVHTYADPGAYTAVLLGVGDHGESGMSTVSVTVSSSPRAASVQLQVQPSSPGVGQPVNFTYSAEGPAGTTAQISFGDGFVEPLVSLTGTATHVYTYAGIYAAFLMAIDSSAQVAGAASAVVQVGASEGPG